MGQWQPTAERLRAVRRASSLFMDLWVLSRLARSGQQIARLERDLHRQDDGGSNGAQAQDWSYLYRGNILDD